MTCPHCRDAAKLFNERAVRWELKRYRRRGPAKTTRLLVAALEREGVEGKELLDVGAGLGAVQHALLEAGAARATSADASPAYEAAAREEAVRRGVSARVTHELGDFVEMAARIPAADVVTLDRVICCYPDMPALVEASAGHARELWGAVFPRERLLTRIGIRAINLLQRLRRSSFRVYLHPTERVRERLRSHGFTPAMHETTALWQVMVWRRSRA